MKTTQKENISGENTQDYAQDRNRPAQPPFFSWDPNAVAEGLRSRQYQGKVSGDQPANSLLRGGK